jgi:hypothetical protein
METFEFPGGAVILASTTEILDFVMNVIAKHAADHDKFIKDDQLRMMICFKDTNERFHFLNALNGIKGNLNLVDSFEDIRGFYTELQKMKTELN